MKFYIHYHIVGGKLVSEIIDFKTSDEAVNCTASKMKKETISITAEDQFVEIKTKHITHYEILQKGILETSRGPQIFKELAEEHLPWERYNYLEIQTQLKLIAEIKKNYINS